MEKHMTGEELAKLGELRAHFAKDAVPGSAAERFLCDANLCRYLRARQWDVAKAIHMLQGALEWRAKSGVDEIRFEHVKAESVTGKIQRLPHLDKHGRPILVLRPGRENTKDPAQQMAFLAWNMEASVRSMPAANIPRGSHVDLAPEQHTVVIDYTGYSLLTAPGRAVVMETLNIMQVQYCERLGTAILLSPPTLFQVCWALVKPFLDKRTTDKIKFVPDPTSPKGHAIISPIFDPTVVDTSLKAFDPAAYEAWVTAEEEAYHLSLSGKM